jgi:ketosteroid isomerase-like protein
MTAHKLMIATPFDGGDLLTATVTLGYHRFVRYLERHMSADVLDGTALFACDVVRARNRAAGMVLRDFPAVTHVLWLDSDNFPEDDAQGAAVVQALLDSGHDVVAAPYTRKRTPTQWVHQGVTSEPDAHGFAETHSVGFGFTMTSTRALRQLNELSFEDLVAPRYWDLPHDHEVANLFGQVYASAGTRDYLASEDYSFCKRWRDTGGKVYVLARGGLIMHAGSKAYSARDMGPR